MLITQYMEISPGSSVTVVAVLILGKVINGN